MFQKLFYPRQALLISSAHKDKANLAATNWITPASVSPPMLALSLPNSSLTADLINRSKEFVVAVPHDGMREAVLLCLATSGRYIDKFAESKLTQAKAEAVSAPLVAEALANIECRVLNIQSCGQNSLIIGEVLKTHFPSGDKAERKLLFDNGEKDLFAFELVALPQPAIATQTTESKNGQKAGTTAEAKSEAAGETSKAESEEAASGAGK